MELTADHLYNQPDLNQIDAGINGGLVDAVREAPSVRTLIITGAAQLHGGSAVQRSAPGAAGQHDDGTRRRAHH